MITIQGLKFRWHLQEAEPNEITQLAAKHYLTIPITHALFTRGYTSSEKISELLSFDSQQHIADPALLKSCDQAVTRILSAIEKQEKILIFGDYDVDGITSTSLMLLALIPLNAKINFFLPVRKKHGYGLSEYAVEQAHKNNYSLIVTVDNGISAFPAAELAKKLGIDLIITDHHKPHKDLPPAYCIVNPQQSDCLFPHKNLAGVGVIFKVISQLYKKIGKELPRKIYELLMLGTIADVVPLIHENRHWVLHGLSLINEQKSESIARLLENANLAKNRIGARDIGFMVTPQINALGRLDDPRDAVKFLISSDPEDVARVGDILKKINEERKKVERDIYEEIEIAIKKKLYDLSKEFVLIAGNNAWPAGVIGLVAGKLTYSYGKPTFLFHLTSEGIAKGSCRSVKGLDLFSILEANKDLLISFGGHSAAAGLSLRQNDLSEFKKRISQTIASKVSLEDLQPQIIADAPLEFCDINKNLIKDLERLEPFGMGNEEPIFVIHDLSQVKPPKLMKDKHLKVTAFSQGIIKPIVFFNRPELYDIFKNLEDKPFSIIGTITQNEWNETTSTEIIGIDVKI
ncbi:single-stranded-DNA-specific exonuclease RecJ [Candidatus Dependentiae bacterium]|nr:single-stranded-DNA-specific exonuclease RecJ [Candidatus Dependentiae bacterium]